MAKVKPTISSLDFDGIKTSIINYIKTKREFLDYDFEGSALNSLVDVLAYNTLYYAFYSNMISNESFLDTAKLESSIVSLCKPLGILVPGKSCSRATLSLKNDTDTTVNITSYSTPYAGVLNGINYNFYTLVDKEITPGATEDITLYEAKTSVKDLEITVDLAKQTAFLGSTDIDVDTVSVKVINTDNPGGKIWTRKSTIDPAIAEDSEIYFIERTSSGFVIIFGKRTINELGELTIGKDITEQDSVYVSYLVSSGSGANSLTQINTTPLVIAETEMTYGGTNGPDLDTIKYFAPKYFASNDRAVTKDDYYGILFHSNKIQNAKEINIWGGEDAEPISHGRVFVSILNTTDEEDPRVKDIVNLLKNKSVVTVLPEFVLPVSLVLNAGFNIKLNSSYGTNTGNLEATIRNLLNTEYEKSFNFNFTSIDASILIKSASSAILRAIVDTNNVTIQSKINYSSSDKIIYFKNEFIPAGTIGGAVNSQPIPTNLSYFPVILRDFALEFVNGEPTIGKIVGLYDDGNTNQTTNSLGFDIDELGYVDYKSGIIVLYDTILKEISDTTATYNLLVTPKYPENIISKNEVAMELNITGISFT